MTYSYYPGCTLKNKAKSLDQSARLCAEALGFTLQEIPEWQCCGGVYQSSHDEIAPKLSSVRALVAARDAGQDLVTLCSACHNVIKQVQNEVVTCDEARTRINNYMKLDVPFEGGVQVLHYLEVLRDKVGFDNLKSMVKNPLSGVKVGAYYGCLLLRPGQVMQMDNPENPKIMEDFIRAIGATPVVYAMRNECCGGYLTLEDKSIPEKRSGKIIANAKDQGADLLITACPLCEYNLRKNSTDLPVHYFTELLAQALGIREMEV